MKNINENLIVEKWSGMISKTTGVTNPEKLAWISKYAHYHAINEAADGMGGVSAPYATLYNTPGIGTAYPAAAAGMSGAQQTSATTKGSGDKWPALLPMSLQVAARTIGFDLVNVVPMPGPTGVLSYMDYVYAGGKQPFGAPPATNPANANPDQAGDYNPIYDKYGVPYAFKIKLDAAIKAGLGTVGESVTFANSGVTLNATYIGKDRMDGFPMFKTGAFSVAGSNLSDIFDGSATITTDATSGATVTTYPQLISTLQNQIQGFVGAGAKDNDAWEGTFVSGTTLYEPMERGVGEVSYPRPLGLEVFTKFVQVGTDHVAVNVTLEQVQDLNKQWGIDVLAMVENAGINEISQSMNKHILSRLFAQGWKNHIKANDVEGINLNLDVTSQTNSTTPAFAYAEDGIKVNTAMTLVGAAPVLGLTTAYENQDTLIKRIMANIVAAGNVVMQRGRRGPANFIVTNLKLATALQTNAQYGFSPITNTFNQSNGSLYPLGVIAGMTLYVDPNMEFTDTRVLVGRKGATDEPGTIFCPYLMAESIKLTTEGTGAPKVIIKTRYSLVDAGFHPESQYVTLYIKTSAGAIL